MSACMWVHTSAHIRACRRTHASTQARCVCLSVCTSINYRAENNPADMLPTPILPSIRSEGKERGKRVKNKKTWAGKGEDKTLDALSHRDAGTMRIAPGYLHCKCLGTTKMTEISSAAVWLLGQQDKQHRGGWGWASAVVAPTPSPDSTSSS